MTTRSTNPTETAAKPVNVPEPGAQSPAAIAQRALAEAKARGADAPASAKEEIGGRGGLDPARYGDWEVKGLASDF